MFGGLVSRSLRPSSGRRTFAARLLERTSSSSSEASATAPPPSPTTEAPSQVDPLSTMDFFGVHRLFTVSDLFSARVHLGHRATNVDPRMRDFVFGVCRVFINSPNNVICSFGWIDIIISGIPSQYIYLIEHEFKNLFDSYSGAIQHRHHRPRPDVGLTQTGVSMHQF